MTQEIKEVPKAERLEVYKKALEIVKDFKGQFHLTNPYICLLCPLIYRKRHSSFVIEDIRKQSKKMFPELKKFTTSGYYRPYANEERIAFLTETIKRLES